ncbi:hypothetical protein HP499_15055 [Paenarthrobacter sp. CM16]|uniref:hypothetical protein n=1 Tax=Paenarthrobacter sp. CM16 TaxID=2738447 RepID=UPI0015525D0A|nr:hypothetical protein [Paenarthrobacter sp. CM16]NQD89105.1 hypothetical protein [Paenarthrobacter sp. CM16]
MRNHQTSTLDRLTAADPAMKVTEDELARSREKSLAVTATDAEQLSVGGSVENSHRRPPHVRRLRMLAGAGLAAAAAAVVVGVVLTSSMPAPPTEQAAPAATQPGTVPEVGSSGPPLPPVFTAKGATGANEIVTGSNGRKAAVSTDQGVNLIMEALHMGTLGLSSGGCIVSNPGDGKFYGLIFPFGTKVSDEGVVLPDGVAFNIGDEFSFGGGGTPEGLPPNECLPSGDGFLVQSWRDAPVSMQPE